MTVASSESQCANVFTKAFKDVHKWEDAVSKIGVATPDSDTYYSTTCDWEASPKGGWGVQEGEGIY